jgi:hemin uptake protein HemP
MNMMSNVPQPLRHTQTEKIDTYDARDLIKNNVQACVVLDDQTYYLRITRAGKLILTK